MSAADLDRAGGNYARREALKVRGFIIEADSRIAMGRDLAPLTKRLRVYIRTHTWLDTKGADERRALAQDLLAVLEGRARGDQAARVREVCCG